MRDFFEHLERLYLTWFPLIFGLLVLPGRTPTEVFLIPKLSFLSISIIIFIILKAINSKNVSISDLFSVFIKQKSYIHLALLLSISACLSATISQDSGIAWFGQQDFRTGAFFIFLCSLLFWVYSTSKNLDFTGFYALIISVSSITVLEYLGFRPLYFMTDKYINLISPSPYSTIGQRGHLSGLLVLFSLFVFSRYKEIRPALFWLMFILSFAALGCTSNTSSMISVFIAFIAYSALKIQSLDYNKSDIMKIVLAISLLFSYKFLGSINTFLVSSGITANASSSKVITNGNTFQSRKILWISSLKMTMNRPILGWGPQTFQNHWFEFTSKEDGDQLFRIELGISKNQKMVRINDSAAYKDSKNKTIPAILYFSSPHNFVMDILYSQGLLGLLIFLTLSISIGRYIITNLGLTGLTIVLPLMGYFIYLQGWFILITVTPIACYILGSTIASIESRKLPLKIKQGAESA